MEDTSLSNFDERVFWTDAFMVRAAAHKVDHLTHWPESDARESAQFADQAMREYRSRFKDDGSIRIPQTQEEKLNANR